MNTKDRLTIQLLAIVCTLVGSLPAGAASTRLLWQYPGVENVVSVAWIEDLDGDAVSDVLFESYDAGAPQTDHLFAISGASEGTGTVIWSARPLGGPSNSGGYGEYCLSVSPDLNGDGTSEVLYGAAWGNRSAFALDGMNGSTIWSFDTYSDSPPVPPASGWVYAVSTLGSDLTGDDRPEVLFCAGSDNHCVYCANGATGEILWYYRGQDAIGYVQSIADVDDDGIRDVVACQIDNYPKVYVFSGAGAGGAASLIWSASLPGSPWACCELTNCGQPTATLVLGCWSNAIYGYDAANGTLRWTGNVGAYVMRTVVIRDVDGDGIDDLGVASWGNAGRIHSGADGATIWATPVGDDCWACDAVEDVTGDGIDELAVGSFNGRVYLMDGVDGTILWNYYVGDKIFTIRGVPDLTGNGIADVVAGTQMLSSSGGICYAFEGNDDVIGASVEDPLAQGVGVLRASPNPTRGETRFRIVLPEPASSLALQLFDPSGRMIRVIESDGAASGPAEMLWNGYGAAGERLPAGVYLGRLVNQGRILGVEKVLLLP